MATFIPERFHSGDFAGWLRDFDCCATANGWSTEDKGLRIKHMTTVTYRELLKEQRTCYRDYNVEDSICEISVIHIFKSRFSVIHLCMIANGAGYLLRHLKHHHQHLNYRQEHYHRLHLFIIVHTSHHNRHLEYRPEHCRRLHLLVIVHKSHHR